MEKSAEAPRETGLTRKSIVNVSQLLALAKTLLTERIGHLDGALLQHLDHGLRLVFAL